MSGAAIRLLVFSGLALWAGATLLLAELRWLRRPSLVDRLRPYAVGASSPVARGGPLSVESFRDVITPIAATAGARLARLFGVEEDAATRLSRIHSPLDPATFRIRQLGWTVLGFAAGLVLSVALRLPGPLAALGIVGLPLLAFLVVEQQLATASTRWQQRLVLELPVVAEQLGMLLSAGFSLGGALNRLAARGKGCTGRDLQRVCRRLRQGVSEVDAVREWADLAAVAAVDRLASLMALNREAGDLGRLVGDEARSLRRDVHRQLVEQVERRGQQVWIPVTVATLLPGVVFLAVPFVEALRLFTKR